MKSTDEVFENAGRAYKFLKALANDNRMVILSYLASGKKNVGELEDILGIRQPTLSQQLAWLRADDLVSTRRNSRQIYYSLSSDETKHIVGLLHKLFCSDDVAGTMGVGEAA